jgi:ribonuclease D
VLKAVARWREETAASRDIPRGWVVKDPSLVEIARRAPKSIEQLRGIRGLNPREAERSGGEILRAVDDGLAAPEITRTKSPPREAQTKARMLSGLADAIIRARSESAGIATELVSTRGDLEAMLTDLFARTLDEDAYKLLRGWRRELAGQAVLDLASGRVAVKVTDHKPYVEELPLT